MCLSERYPAPESRLAILRNSTCDELEAATFSFKVMQSVQNSPRSALHMRICLCFDHQLNTFNLASPYHIGKSKRSGQEASGVETLTFNRILLFPSQELVSGSSAIKSKSSSRLASKHQRGHNLAVIHLKGSRVVNELMGMLGLSPNNSNMNIGDVEREK